MESETPFSSPIPPSLENYSGPHFGGRTVQKNPLDQTLESVFSRLNVSIQQKEAIGYPGNSGGESSVGSGYRFGGGFARTGHERTGVIGEGTEVGFDGLMKVGPNTERWETFMYSSYQSHLFDSSGHKPSHEYSILPSSNQNGLFSAAAAPGAGCSMTPSNNRNITRSRFNSHNTFHNNLTNNSFRMPRWLQEPLNCSSLGDLRGRLVALAKDQYGCRFLQQAIHEASKEEIDMIFMEVIGHVCELMLDPFANIVVQNVLDVCSEEQKNHILLMVVKDGFRFVNMCQNLHGVCAIRKLLEKLTTQQQISRVITALIPRAVALTKDMNGRRVLQCCLTNFPDEYNKYLLNEVADNCYQIAIDKSGCCALQHCVDHSKGEAREHLVQEIIANALNLAEDQYGNYVVQHVLGLKEQHITESLLCQLEGNFASLSCNRYGSHVVEKCLVEWGEEESMRIIIELLRSPIVSRLLVDPFGNYVIQSALAVSESYLLEQGLVYNALLNLVWENYPMMRSHVYGKWVLVWLSRLSKREMLSM
ncbi:Pumilio domain-containing protein C4G8.03c [Hibiscus syriacus]|uniref:Pumilio domain-containing protein C4G8.03c n=1 Tax=Hibiscus syriacus TaxID=106335 RepID=A0A6A2YTW0_HIBSY|nr:pumilio homolog 15-like [Hibiscus syriacus]KAE8682787.1 Pumilio domain-containing protein C4G8.03c [Hibiscus syriacus]